mmetsp:Transcript_49350/g.99363  ORF Transcript_49350/g.99363 Transcript_49350/m.99363 type:complete len:152 (+) Transcript_49350:128-583(+)|eukprot:CAMPEP_0171619380 /NCGR_PEP_ID=MMETSP0990-20121206/15341_1 /TAXON_ID=483369 /ORGANISM="non described non described, Strain CCMP2098" /LENGTH=151 /DNA_ID=CAMNT_0012184431 /DNA_START=128 /DNA_END=583 /DNA_ORIENTATION=+
MSSSPDDLRTPCSSTAVDGAARGVLLGLCWGVVFEVSPLVMVVHGDATSPPPPAPPSLAVSPVRRLFTVAQSMGRSALGFALFLSVYNGTSCTFERLRGGRKDPLNAFGGGAAAGALAGLSTRNPRSIGATALGTGLLTGAVAAIQEYGEK